MPTTHKFVSSKPNSSDATLASKNAWDDTHSTDLAITAVSAGYNQLDTDECIHGTGGSGGITVALLTAVGRTGRVYRIVKVDSGAGVVTVQPNGGQTINGFPNWTLAQQWQYVEYYSDGSNLVVKHAN